MKKSKKILALVMALVMIATAIPMMTASADAGGYGDAVEENKHKHVYVIQSEVEGSCTEPAKTTFKCECGDVKVMETGEPAHIPADSKSYKEKNEKVHTNYCKVCKELYEEAHVEEDWVLVVDECIEPTCAKAGKNVYKCKDCGFKKTEVLEPTVHTPSGIVVKDDNKHSFTCSFCEKLIDEKHVWDEGTPDGTIKCGDEGKVVYKCLVAGCGATKEEKVPASCFYYDKEDIANGNAPKATKFDEKEHTFECKYCSKDKAEAHEFVVTYGYIYGKAKYYDNADIFEFFAEGEEAMPVAEEPTVAPTEKPTEKPSEASSCTHKNTDTKETPATCVKDGVKVTYCKDCKEELSTDVIPATGHNLGPWETQYEATCGNYGYKVQECSNCDYFNYEYIEPTGNHSEEWVFTIVPTVDKDGKQVCYCKKCDSIIGERTVKLSVPTCKEEGRIHVTCKYCNYEADEVVDTVNHNFDKDTKWEYYTISQHKAKCDECGAVVKADHTWSDWEVTLKPTTEKKGEKVRVCTGCGYKDVKEMDVLTVSLGDINGDGKITAVDARIILQNVAGLTTLDNKQKEAADVNGDGNISAVDARIILQVVAGLREI